MRNYLLVIFVISIITFFTFGYDKNQAKKHRYRVPEQCLLLLCFWGGALGGLLGMLYFHHKTRKWKFKIIVPLCLVLHIILFYKILTL